MKKCLFLIILFIMFIPFMVKAETCNTNDITIESIKLDNKSDNVKELSEATIVNNIIKLDLKMSDVEDYAEYEMVVKNDSSNEYMLNSNIFNTDLSYIEYTFITNDESNIIKANTSEEVKLRVEYKNGVPDEAFENNIFKQNNNVFLVLSNGEESPSNPNTKDYIFILILIAFMSVIFILLTKYKYPKIIVLIIGIIIMVPVVHAICRHEITIESNIEIEIPEDAYYYNVNLKRYYSSINGALSKASSNQTIKVIKDKGETSSVTIPADLENLTIDFNNHIVSFDSSDDYSINNEGKIKFINSSYNNINDVEIWLSSKILNNGSMEINSGIYIETGNITIFENYGNLSINGANIYSEEDGSQGLENYGTFNMTAGSLSAGGGIDNYSTVNISGGYVWGPTGINNAEEAFMNLSGDAIISGIYAIINRGELNANGGKVIAIDITSPIGIENYGIANINNIEIESTTQGYNNNVVGIVNYGELYFNSGTIDLIARYDAKGATGIANIGNLHVSGGEIISIGEGNLNHSIAGIGVSLASNSTTTIIGGIIKGTSTGINATNNNYTLTLGENDGNVSTSTPEIYATNGIGYGIKLGNEGTFNYYDGIIKAKSGINSCFSGTAGITNLPTGYIIQNEINDSIGIAYLAIS